MHTTDVQPFPCFTYKSGRMHRGVQIESLGETDYAYYLPPDRLLAAFGDPTPCAHTIVAVEQGAWVEHHPSLFWVGGVRHYLIKVGETLTITAPPTSTLLYQNGHSDTRQEIPGRVQNFVFDGLEIVPERREVLWTFSMLKGHVHVDPHSQGLASLTNKVK